VGPAQRHPFRALVKDFVEEAPEPSKALVKSMLRELKALNLIGVYVTDVKYENYKRRYLVDFSISITEPYLIFREEYRSRSEIIRRKIRNL
jgi:hypothetical protein